MKEQPLCHAVYIYVRVVISTIIVEMITYLHTAQYKGVNCTKVKQWSGRFGIVCSLRHCMSQHAVQSYLGCVS